MKTEVKYLSDIPNGSILQFDDKSLGLYFKSGTFRKVVDGSDTDGWQTVTRHTRCDEIGSVKYSTRKIDRVYRNSGFSLLPDGVSDLDFTLYSELIWDRKKVDPQIEINVKINGTTAKLHDISEESLKKLRDLSERQDRETPDDEEDFFSPEDYR